MTQVPTYQYGGGDMPPHARKSNGLAVGSLVCGIIAFIVAWIPCINLLAMLLALVALVLGIIGWIQASKEPGQKPTLAIIGIVLAVLAFIAFFVSYFVLGRLAETYGGQLGRAGIVFGAEQQANVYEQQARERGVDEATIEEARAELQAVLDAVPQDVEQLEQAQEDVEDALDRFQERLRAAPAATDPDMDEPGAQPEADDTRGGGGS